MDGLIAFYLILFPFGKLTGLLPDLIVLLISLFFIIKNNKYKLNNFLFVCIFSLFFSLSFFKLPQLFTGVLYLVRLVSYLIFSEVIYKYFGKTRKKRELIFNSLIVIGVFTALFGWFQYFIFPDIRFLKAFNWDDHYFRLVSTFLDPAFTGIILVLAEILVLVKSIHKFNTKFIILNTFLIFTILFTYSRASYFALSFSIIFLILKFRKKFLLFMLFIFFFLIPILPKASSEGTNLSRTYSMSAKLTNYTESYKLIRISPVFGVGFNNICVATTKNFSSHSCSGLDNSILFIIATTGIVGLIIFTQFILSLIENTKLDIWGWGLMVSLIAIFIHGMFTETFFYNFILGWLAIFIGVTRKRPKG